MNINRKFLIPLLAVLCLAVGYASATIIAAVTQPKTNIFERTKNECPGVKWDSGVDSSNAVSPIKIEGDLYFAGERVPLEDPEVKERLERELQINTYWHSNTLLCLKSANRYFDAIEKILADNGVPDDFKYLAVIESNLRNDVSPAGAVGFWQFMKGSAKIYGLEVTDEVDERYDFEKSTTAACKLLKESKAKFGTWAMACAAYNMGPGGLEEHVKQQKENNYYNMYLNSETSRYVFRILALKVIFSNPAKAGFSIKPEELYQPFKYKTVEVDGPIASIADFAAKYSLKYKHIKLLNPWLRSYQLVNAAKKHYQIKILEQN